MTNLDSILKCRDITLPTKVCLIKAVGFPVIMYGCESWTIKKDECRRIDAFELWCWRRLLRVPWTARRSNQSILKEISPGYSLEGLMLKLKLQYVGHLMWITDSLEKTLTQGMIEGRRRRGRQRMSWLDGVTDSMDMGLSRLWSWCGQGILECCGPWGHKELDTTKWLNQNLRRPALWPSMWSSWRMFHMYLKTVCILLLDGKFYRYTLSLPILMCHLKPSCAYWFSMWIICPLI